MIRDRIRKLLRLPAARLRPHPRNWRVHPAAQREHLAAALREIGLADALLVRPLPGGLYEILDGHLRADLLPDQPVPCLVLDLDESESLTLLATLDPQHTGRP